MKLPAGYASRPPTWDDLDAVVTLFKACHLADDGVEDPVREHIEDAWRTFVLERDAVLVFAPDGSLAAYAEAFGLNPELSLEGYVQVSPSDRGKGIGTTLASWVERRALDHDPCLARLVEGAGWIDSVAVRRSWRGRGIARTLLTRSFAAFAGRGAARVLLNVDSDNASGATRLYESVGMRVRRSFHIFEKRLKAG